MSSRDSSVTAAFGRECALELASATGVIQHCLKQLSEEQVWARPCDSMNSVGNLLLHLCGNVRQWIIAGVGGAEDTRERQKEFDERGPIPKADLLAKLEATVQEASAVCESTSEETLLEPKRIQGFESTGLGAILHSASHFRGHTQEIVHMSRTLLGKGYEFAFVPKSTEQGA